MLRVRGSGQAPPTMRLDTYRGYLNKSHWEREADFVLSLSLGNVLLERKTNAFAIRISLRTFFFPLDGCSTRQSDLFGKVSQQAAEGGVRAGIELECNRWEVTVVEQRPELREAFTSYGVQIQLAWVVLAVNDRTATGRLTGMMLVSVWRGSTVRWSWSAATR